ncbi:hypothetical protein BJX63DRAFT_184578 [Aspergillus granulosus]|uniref:Uncharacterized protein n=1 Tax=Aspergillus granulosus TaxID=176169 RepID=A0ABR4HIF0_9EURO
MISDKNEPRLSSHHMAGPASCRVPVTSLFPRFLDSQTRLRVIGFVSRSQLDLEAPSQLALAASKLPDRGFLRACTVSVVTRESVCPRQANNPVRRFTISRSRPPNSNFWGLCAHQPRRSSHKHPTPPLILRLIVPARPAEWSLRTQGFEGFKWLNLRQGPPVPAMIDQKSSYTWT